MLELIMRTLLIFAAADTACTESGRDYKDGRVVLQVVINRSKTGWGRYDGTLWNALFSRSQHAHWCKWPLTAEHLAMGMEFVQDSLRVPAWAKKALWYCNIEKPGTCEDRCPGGCELRGRFAHRFYGEPSKKQKAYARTTSSGGQKQSLQAQ